MAKLRWALALQLFLCQTLLPLTQALKAFRHVNHGDKDKPEKRQQANFVKGLRFKHRLRVCNAYPNVDALDVYQGKDKLTEEGPLPYASCIEFRAPLQSGDRLEFKIKDASAGTFAVADLPNHDAVMLLIIHRHDTRSTAVAFESHVFANLLNAQVAVIDTYKGRAHGFASITDGSKREEKLRYNSVVAVNPGEYKVSLEDARSKRSVIENLVALNRESYVVIRTGVESTSGKEYPQDLIVYPVSDPALLHSAAPRAVALPGLLALVLLAAFRQ